VIDAPRGVQPLELQHNRVANHPLVGQCPATSLGYCLIGTRRLDIFNAIAVSRLLDSDQLSDVCFFDAVISRLLVAMAPRACAATQRREPITGLNRAKHAIEQERKDSNCVCLGQEVARVASLYSVSQILVPYTLDQPLCTQLNSIGPRTAA
jgi:hypothetical protein